MLRRTLSTHPNERASSTASGQVMLGMPEPFLWNPTRSSLAVAWCFSSHARNSDGVAKNRGRIGSLHHIGRAAPKRRYHLADARGRSPRPTPPPGLDPPGRVLRV